MRRYLGIEIGGTKLQLVTGDETGRIEDRRRFAVEKNAGAAGIRKQIEDALPEFSRKGSLEAAGVGFGGPVDWRSGRIARSHHVEGWSGFDLKGWLEGLTGAPVRIDNDANIAALGEATFGAGAGCDPMFYVTLGSGVGGGLIVNGRIYHGATPGEAEIGHVRLDRSGATVESRCSGWAVDRRIRDLIARDPAGLLARLVGETQPVRTQSPASLTKTSLPLVTVSQSGGEARHLATALGRGDVAAGALLSETAEDLAFGLSHVVHLFHPQIIILGGGLSGIGEPLRAAVADFLPRFVMEAFAPGPRVVLTALGEDAVPAGALALARELP